VVNAQLFKTDETQAIYERITAPTLCVVASTDSMSQWWKDSYTLDEFMQRIAAVPHLTHAVIEEAGHMLHHDQPAILARHIEEFLSLQTVI
jgi:pimeloyl-ACP methyl ester carboxylesterase